MSGEKESDKRGKSREEREEVAGDGLEAKNQCVSLCVVCMLY